MREVNHPTKSQKQMSAPTKGRQTRTEILDIAAQVASAEGLEGVSLGRLAQEVGMSKSGLFAHFRSKQELQLAVVETARSLFIEEVIHPAQTVPSGLRRLRKLAEAWLSYAERDVFRGGCFFVAASLEFDGRPGAVKDRITEIMGEWLRLLEDEIREAKAGNELSANADPVQLAFEFNSQMMGANWAYQLLGVRKAFARARTAIVERLDSFAVCKVVRRAGSQGPVAAHRSTAH
jgi:AcrR family transcriptional regulator